ncbi:hypothetical protein LMK08_00030 [Metapseudomonas furukawaii]|uniref:hypothetical protein n=1 Tax=Metapseudomonas furukawaii TaxID=1149133 RepID=UPI00227A36A4|nr:hypothetical protein [Pseudomonas furukawaii]WAG81865.1 hypothetical protein LMK08_00030 [Pseudomonas furukawaii]
MFQMKSEIHLIWLWSWSFGEFMGLTLESLGCLSAIRLLMAYSVAVSSGIRYQPSGKGCAECLYGFLAVATRDAFAGGSLDELQQFTAAFADEVVEVIST